MMREIEDLLRRTMGLEAATIGATVVARAVRQCMAHARVETEKIYLARLESSPDELQHLIEAVVVPESWFFRDGTPFQALRRWAMEEWQSDHPGKGQVLRVLSVPCSTGEEPASIAMTLLDAGLSPERFVIDAVDISRHALARAARAVYPPTSFRGVKPEMRERYFTALPDGNYALAPEVRRQVRLVEGNLLAPGFRPGGGNYHAVFCRNLLIYFDRSTQARAVKTLVGLLAGDGLFFIGHAEAGALAGSGFVPSAYTMSFAFRKAAASPLMPSLPVAPLKTTRLLRPAPTVTRRVFMDRLAAAVRQKHAPVNDDGEELTRARVLANQGRLDEARQLCETFLRKNNASGGAWYLLGVTHDATGNARRAAECYAKTLYLEPNHLDALLQQALLAEQSGDVTGAEQFRRRIARVQQRAVPS